MKGKVKSIYKFLILAVALICSVVCVGIGLAPKKNKVYAAKVNYTENDYSAVDSNGLILSVEKVALVSTDDTASGFVKNGSLNDSEFRKELSLNSNGTNLLNRMLVRKAAGSENDYDAYYYQNIRTGMQDKYVVRNGEFVMLENTPIINDDKTYYYNSSLGQTYQNNDGAWESVDLAEGIMISFGGYVKVGDDVYLAGQDEVKTENSTEIANAGIHYLNMTITKDGQVLTLPGVRESGDNNNQDLTCVIPQAVGNDGHYVISVQYSYNERTYAQTFEFYLLFNSSYEAIVTKTSGNTYSTKPVVENATDESGVYHYYLGGTNPNQSYPTLIYDYTKYKMSYTLTANGKVTRYNVRAVRNSIMGNISTTLFLEKSVDGTNSTSSFRMQNFVNNDFNFVTFVFTEIGEYEFEFEYIYAANENIQMNLQIANQRLAIHGFELKYSKVNKEEAVLRYLQLSSNREDGVDVIVPNGYEKGNIPQASKLGVIYDLVSASNKKVGSVESVLDANLNDKLSREELNDLKGGILSDNAKKLLSNAENYVKTNQGSLWLSTNDEFSSNSFYYFSKSAINNFGDLEKLKYNNTISFNQIGYYLVFIDVEIEGLSTRKYTQVFAFQYTTDTITINANAVETDSDGEVIKTPIGSNKWTNKNVEVSWAEPGIFEKNLIAKYYSVTNQFLNKEQLLSTTGYSLENGQSLGSNIADNQGASFLIEIKSEGVGASYRMFTIDRQHISGVGAYQVRIYSTSSTNRIYEIATTALGNPIRISNSITNSLSTLFWDDKASGAKIEATYSFTPFVRDSSVAASEIYRSSSQVWFSTNYKLGNTVGGFELEKPTSLYGEVNYKDVLFKQGVYLFTLTDEAGNSTKFMLVIDDMEAYFRVSSGETEASFISRTSNMFGSNVNVEVGTHKVVNLIASSLSNEDSYTNELYELLTLAGTNASDNQFASIGYYSESDSNIATLKNLFGTLGGRIYLTVRNNSLSTFDSEGQIDQAATIPNLNANSQVTIRYTENGSTSTIRTLYLLGANQTNTTATQSNSFVVIEINKDNSRGMVYYSNNAFDINAVPTTGNNGERTTRLFTGEDVYTADGKTIRIHGIQNAHATGDNYVGFVWNMGTGAFEIDTIEFDYYLLNLKSYSKDEGDITSNRQYYYSYAKTVTLYNGAVQNGAALSGDGTRGFALLNVENGQTLQGLYVVRRIYKLVDGTDLGDDKPTQTYYFIVDREGIINQNNSIHGGNITINLKEDETHFNSFSAINLETSSFTYYENNVEKYLNKSYNVYLTTDKLPITLSIPQSKFFDGTLGSMYFAGRLEFELYFNDYQTQLDSKARTLKLFEGSFNVDSNSSYFNINFKDYAGDLTPTMKEKFIYADNDSSWICLPGDYILIIKDKVEGSQKHEKVIGFRIEPSVPNLNVYSVPERELTIENSLYKAEKVGANEYSITTSEEFVKIDMPEYLQDDVLAGVDLNYLVVTQNLNGRSSYYIRHEYSTTGGSFMLNDSNPSVVKNIYNNSNLIGRTIYLQTYLRDNSGNILLENLNNTLSYDIYIRYNLSGNTAAKYLNCYYYYDSNGVRKTYYETHYHVEIDRVAPSNNIQYIVTQDGLINYYNQENDSPMFESSYHETNSNVYFVNQYASYYATNDSGKIYGVRVTENTAFNSNDIERLYYRQISDTRDLKLNLPVINYASYTLAGIDSNTNKYNFLGNETGLFYEILEIDKAGNTTQYVIFFDAEYSNSDAIRINLGTKLSDNGTIKDANISYDLTNSQATYSNTIFDVSLPTNNNGEIISAIDSSLGGSFEQFVNDRFFRISLTSNVSGQIYYINTNFQTSFTNSGLATDIIEMIKSAGPGNYRFRIESRTKTLTANINYYDESERVKLNVESLVEVVNNQYQINLQGATITQNDIIYYAPRIEITHNGETKTYICKPEENYSYYEELLGGLSNRLTGLNGTYHIKMFDAFGESSSYRFNTAGEEYYSISFGANNNANSVVKNNIYYAFTQANVKFDNSLYEARIIATVNSGSKTEISSKGSINTIGYLGSTIVQLDGKNIFVYPYWGGNNLGANVQVTIKFMFNNETEFEYNICIDTRTGAVNLTTDNIRQLMDVYNNIDYLDPSVISTKVTSGTTNLTWATSANANFNFAYTLFELQKDGSYSSLDLTGSNGYVIQTSSTSAGIYKFVIDVLSTDGKFLGNKIYVFTVEANSSDLYYVRLGNNSVGSNSTFLFSDFDDTTRGNIANALRGSGSVPVLPTSRMPLYVYNKELTVVTATDKGANFVRYINETDFGGSKLLIYRIYTSTYSLYFGILQVEESSDIIQNVKLNTEKLDLGKQLKFTRAGEKSATYTLNFEQILTVSNNITQKNNLQLQVYYNDQFVKTYTLTRGEQNKFSFDILGNGQYKFEFADLAGNKHIFTTDLGLEQSGLELQILREMVVSINGEAPIENAYYNGQVVLNINNSVIYNGNINLFATRNGNAYIPTKNQYNYTFTEPGSYRVTVVGKYLDGDNEFNLRKVLVFTIINENEARESIDLTALGGYKITSVINGLNQDVTDAFNQLLNPNENSMLITYDMLLENSTALGITSGKQRFTLTYSVEDSIYPERTVSFTFTMNNERPFIECSLAPGETSTKGFSITINPGIIYEQVGDSFVYINDELVYTITDGVSNEIVTIERTQKASGAGDYYVSLRSSSGQVITSFKVVLKVPLNASAIIIIVVVVAVVTTIVVTIIVLRRKMRIR